MDIKEKINEIVEMISKDTALQAQFKKDPIKAVEQILGINLPDDIMEKIITGVKTALTADQVSDVLGKLKKLF